MYRVIIFTGHMKKLEYGKLPLILMISNWSLCSRPSTKHDEKKYQLFHGVTSRLSGAKGSK